MKILKILYAAIALSASASALGFTGNEVRSWYTDTPSADGSLPIGYMAYVSGIFDTMNGIAICAPSTVTYKQLAAIAKKHIEANPKHWNQNGAGLILMGLSEAYPCPKS